MTRLVAILCIAAAAGAAGTAWVLLRAGAGPDIDVPSSTAPATAPVNDLGLALRAARTSCDLTAVDDVVARIRAAVAAAPNDAPAWHLLAEAHLERSLLRSHERGIAVATPAFPTLPQELVDDLDAGQAAATRAHELGDESGDLYRIEAALMSQRIVGLATALQWNGKIHEALKKSGERAPDNPHLHVALGLRRLLTPKWLGQDLAEALERFEFAAKALTHDERPAVFAGMASWLLQKRQQAIAWLEQAVARNPNNRFARVVLKRLRAGEDDPFGREVTATESAATK